MTDNYNKKHCWQYDIRLRNKELDLIESELTEEEVNSLRVSDFTLSFEEKENVWKEAKEFIYKKIAKEAGIEWKNNWQQRDRIIWDNVPDEIEEEIRKLSRDYMKSCPVKDIPRKHKYCYVLGETSRETRVLKKEFENLNKKLIKPYPKERGK